MSLVYTEPVPVWSHHHPRKKQVRKLMRRRMRPNRDRELYQLSYSKATGSVFNAIVGTVAMFSGSSLNRNNANKAALQDDAAAAGTQLSMFADAEPATAGTCGDQSYGADSKGCRSGNIHARIMSARGLSPRSKAKVRDKFSAFYRASGGKNTFATLTFIQSIGDREAVAVLNKFFTMVRKKVPDINYIWVAERQSHNKKFKDNIHFHIMLDSRLPVEYFNALWVLQQYNAGLVGFSRIQWRHIPGDEVRQKYDAGDYKGIQQLFNPFDIKKVYSIDGLAFYLSKYVSKNKDVFQCRAWHCSRGVSRLFTKKAIGLELFQHTESEKNTDVDKETGQLYEPMTIVNQHCIVRYIVNKRYFSGFLCDMELINHWILTEGFIPDVPVMGEQEYYQRIAPLRLRDQCFHRDILSKN